MKPISISVEFSKAVEECFSFLTEEYAFIQTVNKWDSSTYCMEYKNKQVVLQFHLGFKDEALYITVYKVYANGIVAAYGDYSTELFPLTHFAMYYENHTDWINEIHELSTGLSVDRITDMVKQSARLLKNYGGKIFNGTEWYNWRTNQIENR